MRNRMKNKIKVLILIIFAIFGFSQNGFSLNAQLIITPDLNLEDEWYRTESESVPTFSTIDTVCKKQYVTIVHTFDDFKVDPNKKGEVCFSY
jgi:hypothetical protein